MLELVRNNPGSRSEEELRNLIREKLIKHFEKTAFNQCENQKLNLLEGTKLLKKGQTQNEL